MKNTTSHVLFQISLYRSLCNTMEITFFVSFSLCACRKNTSHGFGFAEFFEENMKEIFKHGSSKLEESPWNDGSSLSFACVKVLGFFYGSHTSATFITPEKVFIHKEIEIEAEVKSMKVLISAQNLSHLNISSSNGACASLYGKVLSLG